jgi:hypothetical protein
MTIAGRIFAPPALNAPSHGVVSFPGLSHFSESRPLPLLPSSEVNLRWHHRGGRLQHQVKLQHRVYFEVLVSIYYYHKDMLLFSIDKSTVRQILLKNYPFSDS